MTTIILLSRWPYLFKQHGLYYVQYFNSKRRPNQKRIPLRTRTKQTALKLKRKLEDEFATGAFDPWLDDAVSIEGEELSKDSTIKEALDQYIIVKSKKDWRPMTAQNTVVRQLIFKKRCPFCFSKR